MILEYEPLIRLLSFVTVLGAMLAVEIWLPRRRLTQSRMLRWTTNLTVTLVNTVLLRLLLPAAAVGLAMHMELTGAGLLQLLNVPAFIGIPLTIVLLDMVIYGQHVIFHRIPLLWRVHRMHHSDIEIDVTTGVRFHPIEIILSMLIKLLAVWILGPPVLGVILFEVLLSVMALFNHSNFHIPEALDDKLRRVIVTPDMHRVHHSIIRTETDSNFGFNLSCWDRWFGTYIAQPGAGHLEMEIGIPEFRDREDIRLDKMLMQPFVPEPPPPEDQDNQENQSDS